MVFPIMLLENGVNLIIYLFELVILKILLMKNGLIYDGRVAQRQSARLLSVMSRYRNSPEPPPPRANVGG